MIRRFFFAVALLCFSVGALLLGLIIFPCVKIFSNSTKDYKIKCSKIIHLTWRVLVKYLEFTGIINVFYDKKIGEIKNKIIVSSHPSYIDIVILIALIPNSLCLAKTSLLNNLIMKNIVQSLYITNDSSVEEFLTKSKEALDEGFNIIIFPTGGRTESGEDVHIHKGAAKLAIFSKYSILPIKITTSESILTKNHSIFQLGSNTVDFNLVMQDEISFSSFNENISEISLRNRICSIIKEKI